MGAFLRGDSTRFVVVVVEQSDDDRRFNRGQLLNVGFREARSECGQQLVSAIFHDVDLLPSPGLLRYYAEPPRRGRPAHIAAPTTWRKYDMPGYSDIFFGGVTAFHPPDFEACNGYPNEYWGWGMEDDQLRLRAGACGAIAGGVERPASGAGAFEDLDGVSVLQRINSSSPSVRAACAPMLNPMMFNRQAAAPALDAEWRGANGLRGLRYHTLREEKRALTGGATWMRLLVKLSASS